MKRRKCFVSNSSSSSYICDICGEEASGWDMGCSEAEMTNCIQGHTFCWEHMKMKDTILKKDLLEKYGKEHTWLEDALTDYDDELSKSDVCCVFEDEVPSDFCPICNMEVLTDRDFEFVAKEYFNLDKDKCITFIKEKFTDYKEFSETKRKAKT